MAGSNWPNWQGLGGGVRRRLSVALSLLQPGVPGSRSRCQCHLSRCASVALAALLQLHLPDCMLQLRDDQVSRALDLLSLTVVSAPPSRCKCPELRLTTPRQGHYLHGFDPIAKSTRRVSRCMDYSSTGLPHCVANRTLPPPSLDDFFFVMHFLHAAVRPDPGDLQHYGWSQASASGECRAQSLDRVPRSSSSWKPSLSSCAYSFQSGS